MSDYSEDAILNEIKRVAAIVELPKLSLTEFRKHSRVSPHTVRRRFGSWEKALKAAGAGDRFDSTNRPISKEESLAELQRVARQLGRNSFTREEFNSCARFRDDTVRRNLGTWHQAMKLAGLNATPLGKRYTDEECYENLLAVWTHYGRAPLNRELSMPPSTVGLKAYTRRFDTWTKSLEAFIERVNSDYTSDDETQSRPESLDASKNSVAQCDRREIRLGLRYEILNRDRFRCVACGRSPATHLGLVLHVDHIVPFAGGGKTVSENLRSLCQECNVGKAAKHYE